MKIKWLFIGASVGILAGLVSVYLYNEKIKTPPPVAVSSNPYESGIYATGIIESYQPDGSNINIYPEVAGRVTEILVKDGQFVKKNAPLFSLDDSVQRATVAKDIAQIRYAKAGLLNVKQQLEKTRKSYLLNKKSISLNTLDNAINAVKIAKENVRVNVEQYHADKALLNKYVIRATVDGVILRVVAAQGGYASPQGSYDTYTQSLLPAVQMGLQTPYLQVRCYLDEILTPRLPATDRLIATMFIRGLNNKSVPLEFVRIQPFTIPNIQLSDERNERVDVRVLPIIFRFTKPTDINVFPGQLVDIYIKSKP